MQNILYAVRCQYLTPNFLKDQMKNCDVLKKLPACREYLARIFKVNNDRALQFIYLQMFL